MTSRIFKYYDTPLWEEFLDDDDSIMDFSKWLQLKIPYALSVSNWAMDVKIVFKDEKDLTYFLLTL